MSRGSLLAVSALLLVMTVVFTWPQSLFLSTRFAAHNDPHFSIWRLAWIAHALATDPRHLFDANIFYPEVRTLAYSDATLLEGIVAAPLLWAGVSPVVAHNLLLLGGIAASGVAMFVLARHLTGSVGAALVSATVFMMVPYRIEHFAHLELQWAMWIPLAFWAVHRAIEERSWGFGVLSGVFLWLQTLSCVYYGVFLAIVLALLVGSLLVVDARRTGAALPALVLGAIVAAALTYPYAAVYTANVGTVGSRPLSEIALYSAKPLDYLATPSQNWWWRWTGNYWGSSELRLFPGALALFLAAVALARRPQRVVWVYAVMCAVAVEFSFGVNGRLYTWLFDHTSFLQGLRAPARFSILAYCALAVLAGFGMSVIERWRGSGRPARLATVAAVLLLNIEYGSAPMVLTRVADSPLDVYKIISGIGPGVVLDLPMPPPDQLPGKDALYALWSTAHWHPMVNGYSGYYPPRYLRLMEQMQNFPDDTSMARLEGLDVRYIVVHRGFYDRDKYSSLIALMNARSELKSAGRYRDPVDEAELFELKSSATAYASFGRRTRKP